MNGVVRWHRDWLKHLLLLLLVAAGPVAAGQGPQPRSAAATLAGVPPFDILHYRLDLTLAMTDERLGGSVSILLMLTAPADSLVLNQAALNIDSVLVDGVNRPFTLSPSSESFAVSLGALRSAGDTLQLRIVYTRDPLMTRPSSRRGYYFFNDSIGNPANLGYTMSEPSDARFWIPCYDDPRDKATAEVHVTVPAGYTAASNGKFLGVTSNGDGTITWHWREDHQIATYLMCITASQFSVRTLPYARAAGDTIPLQYYVWPSIADSIAEYLPVVHLMVANLSARFGPYPFDKYAMSGVVPFTYGGMEHQSITTLNNFYLNDESVVVHELAHQWWGDLVTCGTWSDIWLNESFATYSEALWKESIAGAKGLQSYMQSHLLHFYYGSWYYAVYDPESQQQNLFSDLVYSKGAWVLHTLRGVLGDSLFFKSLLSYREQFAGRSATTRDFQSVVENVAGRDMNWFFSEWIFSPGWPEYSFSWSMANDSLMLNVRQMQSIGTHQPAAWSTYVMPIQIRAFHIGGDTTFVIHDSLAIQSFAIHLPFIPDSVSLDPDSWILKRIVPGTTSAAEQSQPAAFMLEQNYPNPFNPATTIRYTLATASEVTLIVYDVLGREVATLVRSRQQQGEHTATFDGSRLASGVYIYRLSASSGASAGSFLGVRKMLLVK